MKIRPIKIRELDEKERLSIMQRSMEDISSAYEYIKEIVNRVKENGNREIIEGLKRFGYRENITEKELEASKDEIEDAYKKVKKETVEYLKRAAENIRRFHEIQLEKSFYGIEIDKGIFVGRIIRPIEKVGCYIPGGTAAYPSTVLMTVIPAKIAGVKEVIITTPAMKDMSLNPLVLVAADIAGADRIFKIGGPWAIAALSFGTETIPKVDKIVGPGNKYVTAAKMIVYGKVDIDSPAGPSEALIIADESADPDWVTMDFLSQIEHDPNSSSILITTSSKLADEVCRRVEEIYDRLPRKEIFEESLSKYSYVLIAEDIDEAIEFSNEYAPEHLQIMTKDPFFILPRIRNAGSIFLGHYSPVPVGDYASGTNHVLPTSGGARMFSGLSVDDFLKKSTFQYLSREGLKKLKDIVVDLAKEEGLPMHAESVKVRFRDEDK